MSSIVAPPVHLLTIVTGPRPRRTIAVVAILVLVLDGLVLIRSINTAGVYWLTGGDFSGYVRAATALAHGEDPYDTRQQEHAVFYGVALDREGYPYPPAFAELLMPFVLADTAATRYAWTGLSVALCAATAALLGRAFSIRVPWSWTALVLGIFLAGATLRVDIYHGQVNESLLFLLTLGLYLQHKGRQSASGVIWGLAIAVKPFLGIVALYLLWTRNWRAGIASLVTAAIVTVVSFLPTLSHGYSVIENWLTLSAYYSAPPYAARPDNMALRGLLLRLFAPNPFSLPLADNSTILLVASALSLCLLLLAFILAVPRSGVRATPALKLAEFGVVLGLAMSFGPLTEGSHVLYLLPGLAGVLMMTALRRAEGDPLRTNWSWASAAWLALFALRASPVELHPGLPSALDWSPPEGLAVLWTGLPTFLLVAAVLLLADVLRREIAKSRNTPRAAAA